MTPLLYACHPPSFVVIQQLIELGADVSVRDKVVRILIPHSLSIQIFEEKTKCLASDCTKPFKGRQVNY